MQPNQIEQQSFQIILEELGQHSFSPLELSIVQRVIHATADFDFAQTLIFSEQAIDRGVAAIQSGCPVVCDVQMIVAGINAKRLERFGGRLICKINSPEVIEEASRRQATRAEIAMRWLKNLLPEAVVVVGNAPTALLEILRLHAEEDICPLLVIGVPVGFVNAAESKQALAQSSLTYITNSGRKGGSTVAVAIFNALLRLAEG